MVLTSFFFLSVSAMASKCWSKLPYHVLVEVCSYLKIRERGIFAQVCHSFNEILDCPLLWRRFRFSLVSPNDGRICGAIDAYGQHMQHVVVELVQRDVVNRDNALNVLKRFAALKQLRLKCLIIRFIGENPCFYSGSELLGVLGDIVGASPPGQTRTAQLLSLDLGGMSVSLDTAFVDRVSENNPMLEKLNILNKVLVCNVTPAAALRLAQRCHRLTELHLLCASLSDDVLLEFAEPDRLPLKLLSIMYRGRGIDSKTIRSDTWAMLIRRLPDLRVALSFDHTCPTDRVAEVMHPEIPVWHLVMETYTYIYEEINQVSRCYGRTLTHFVLHTPISRNSPELHRALIQLASICSHLREMHVYCLLDLATVERILELRPEMKTSETYTLCHKPWPITTNTPVISCSDVF